MPGNHWTTELHSQPQGGSLLIPLGSQNAFGLTFIFFKFSNTNFMTYKVFYLRRISLLVSIGKGLSVASVPELTALFPCPDRLSATWSTTIERRGVREKYWNLQTTCDSGALESETVMHSCNPGSLRWDAERSVPRRCDGQLTRQRQQWAEGAASNKQEGGNQHRRLTSDLHVCPLTQTLTHTETCAQAHTHAHMRTKNCSSVYFSFVFLSILRAWSHTLPVGPGSSAGTNQAWDVLLTHQRFECAARHGEHFLT